MNYRYIASPSIDRSRWNRAVEQSPRPLAYGYADYLDAVSSHWGGVVAGDYQSILPLPWNAKFLLFRQGYMPPYIQQIGPFGPEAEDIPWENIYDAVPKEIRYLQCALSISPTGIPSESRFNLVLPLNQSHEELFADYSSNHRRNVRRSREEGFDIASLSAEDFLPLADQHYLHKIPEKKRHRAAYYQLIPALLKSDRASIIGVIDPGQKLLAAAFLPRTSRRLTMLIPVTSLEGRDRRAMFFLIDQLVRECSESEMILDFEGSSIPSIARFYKGFGAQKESYYEIIDNRLPLGVKQIVALYKNY